MLLAAGQLVTCRKLSGWGRDGIEPDPAGGPVSLLSKSLGGRLGLLQEVPVGQMADTRGILFTARPLGIHSADR